MYYFRLDKFHTELVEDLFWINHHPSLLVVRAEIEIIEVIGDILEDLEELKEEVHKETMPPQIPSGLLQFQQKEIPKPEL